AIGPLVDGVLDQAIAHEIGVLAWSPLGGGRLLNPQSERERAVHAALQSVAQEAGASISAAAYAWILAHPAKPIPIIGSQRPERIRDARDALKIKFTRAAWYEILTASRQERLP